MSNIINKYYVSDDEYFSDFRIRRTKQNLIVMYTNAQSCANMRTHDEIKLFIENCGHAIDIIIIAETWYKKNETQIYDIPGYSSIHSCRPGRGGGLSMYVKANIEIDSYEIIESDVNAVGADLLNVKGMRKIRVIGMYRPPCRENFNSMAAVLNSLADRRIKHTLVCGDFNIKVNSTDHSYGGDDMLTKYMGLVSENGLELCNNLVTRESSGTVIDHVLSNMTCKFLHNIDTIRNTFSDHNILIATIGSGMVHSNNELIARRRTNYTMLSDNLRVMLLRDMPATTDVDIQYSCLSSSITKSTEMATTTSYVRPKRTKMCPWIDHCPNIIALIREKKNLWQKFKKNERQLRSNDAVKERLATIGRKLIALKYQAKKKYYESRFENCTNSKDTWKAIKEVVSMGKKTEKTNVNLIVDDARIDQSMAADTFARYFASIGDELARQIPSNPDDSYDSYDKMRAVAPNNHCMFLKRVTVEEVALLIDATKLKKSPGIDNIQATVIKNCRDVIAPVLTKIINDSFESGCYPNGLKTARVTPIFKSGSRSSVENYRPISVLPILNNIMERTIYNRLIDFLDRHKVLYNYQYGFRSKCGTSTALTEIIAQIQSQLNDGECATGLFMDLSKAFDTVNHAILLAKLDRAGVRGVAYQLIESYLKDRSLAVYVNGQLSERQPINISVPQGSVLGPLLFLLYINDMSALELRGILRLFADDSAVFFGSNSFNTNEEDLKHDLELISEYFRLNKLTLNLRKTKFVNFGTAKKTNATRRNISYQMSTIERVDCIKYLGLHIDSRLSWTNHIDHVGARISGAIGAISRLHFMPSKILVNIYFSLVHPHLNYVASIWTVAKDTHINKLQVLQRRAIKRCYKLEDRFSTELLFNDVAQTILPLKALGVFQLCTIVYAVLNNILRTNMRFAYETGRRSARHSPKLKRPWKRNGYIDGSIYYRGPMEFEKLNHELRHSASFNVFRTNLKKYLLQANVITQYLY